MKKYTYILLVSLLALTGCKRFDIDEILLEREELSLTVKGELQFSYNPLTCQIGQNITENEYRIYDDALSNWLIVKCNEKPTH